MLSSDVGHPHVHHAGGVWRNPASAIGTWGVRRAGNGVLQVIWTCESCAYVTSAVPHQVAVTFGVDVRTLPIVIDYAGLFARCVVRGCEQDAVELNHFGPRAIFGETAENWPMGYLCPDHHREWGERVTPQLNRRRSA